MEKQSSISNVLSVSTKHVPEAVAEHMDRLAYNSVCAGTNPFLVAGYEYGWFVRVPDDAMDKSDPNAEVPDEILVIMKFAKSLGCDYIQLDADGDDHDELPVFDW